MANECGYGMLGNVSMQFQDSYGTSLTNSLTGIAVTDESLELVIEPIVQANMYGRIGESPYEEGAHVVQGSLNAEANPVTLGWFVKSVLGSPTTTSGTNTQTHVWKTPSADFDCRAAVNPATIEVNRDVGSAGLYYDLVGNTLTMNFANGELMTIGVDFVGAGFSRKAKGSPSYTIPTPFMWDQVSASFDGAAVVDLRDLSVTWNNNVEASHTLTISKAPYRIKRTAHQTVELSGNMVFDSHSYWLSYENSQEKKFVVHVAGAETPNALTLDFPTFRFKSFTPVMNGAGLTEASFTAQATFSVDSNTAFQITLVNTQALFS